MTRGKSEFTSSNYKSFIKTDTRRFRGEWIALVDKKIVAHGKRADVIYRRAMLLHPGEKISLAKVPQKEILVLLITDD